MERFFDYRSPYRTNHFIELTIFEKVIPFIILFALIYLLIVFKNKFKENEVLDKRMRITTGIVFAVIYASHYFLRIRLYGINDSIILPFQLCSISMFLAIILLFTKNRTIYAFTFYAGVLGALVSYITPVLGYDSSYYRYYQFYIAHGLLILTPIYFLFVHEYIPSLKETINAFIILQALAAFMGVYNYINGTDFMFIFVDSSKEAKFPALSMFGGVPYYIIWMELVAISAFAIVYIVINKKAERLK